MQFLRMSELKKKEERLRESRTFFILGNVPQKRGVIADEIGIFSLYMVDWGINR
ncbi:unnamed protein product [Cladocopium goreaui]|uniref:Uncharacterized protein n=1 Tax=Cladocopium goreaui TaxID=2562237 RepID=A0A9P1GKA4_9DINO|nr:unnamed protein product [Cladocopium goreaui]